MQIIEKLLDIIAPNQCLGCGREGRLLCAWCLPDAFDPVPSRCCRCYKATIAFQTCSQCRKIMPLRQVWVVTTYTGIAKHLVQQMKFNPDRSACRVVADWLDTSTPYFDNTLVTYVPTSTGRIRQRGFDHARLIAQAFAAKRELPFATLLVRQGSARQVGSERKTRLAQAKGAYRIKNVVNCQGKHILLIDDIVTTGATIGEAARVLKRAGAKSVSAALFAQTI